VNRGKLYSWTSSLQARSNSGGDTANIDTIVRRSEDGGKTWKDGMVVFDEQDNVAGNTRPVVGILLLLNL
jgi:sialidase-1